jgi:hypothetical protein
MPDTTLTGQISDQAAAAIIRDPSLTSSQYAYLVQNAANRTLVDAQAGLGGDLRQQAIPQLATEEITVKGYDGDTGYFEYTKTVINKSALPPGVEEVYTSDENGSYISGYQQKISLPSNWNPNNQVYANYDATGKLTGYNNYAPITLIDANGNSLGDYGSSWDATGKPQLYKIQKSRGFFGDLFSSIIGFINDLGPIGKIALAYATGGIATEVAALLDVSSTVAGVITNGVFQVATTGNIDIIKLATSPLGTEVAGLVGVDVTTIDPILKNVATTVIGNVITGQSISAEDILVSAAVGLGSTRVADTGGVITPGTDTTDVLTVTNTEVNTTTASLVNTVEVDIGSGITVTENSFPLDSPYVPGSGALTQGIGPRAPVVDASGREITGEVVTKQEAIQLIKDAFAELTAGGTSLLQELADSRINNITDLAIDDPDSPITLAEARALEDRGITLKNIIVDANQLGADIVSRFVEQNIDIVTKPVAGSGDTAVELDIFTLTSALDVYINDPEAARAVSTIIDRAGGNVSEADLSKSNIISVIIEQRDTGQRVEYQSTAASNPYQNPPITQDTTAPDIVEISDPISVSNPDLDAKINEILGSDIPLSQQVEELRVAGVTVEDIQRVTGVGVNEIQEFFDDNNLPKLPSISDVIATTQNEISKVLDQIGLPKPNIDLATPQGIADIMKFFTSIGLPIPATLLSLGAGLLNKGAAAVNALTSGLTGGSNTSGSTTSGNNNTTASIKTDSLNSYNSAISQIQTSLDNNTTQIISATANSLAATAAVDKARSDLVVAVAGGASASTIASLTAALNNAVNNQTSADTILSGLNNNEIMMYESLIFNQTAYDENAAADPTVLATSTSTFSDPTVLVVGYDDDGNLLPGYELDEENNPVFVGTDFSYNDQVYVGGFPAYDDDGNLLPGYELDEENNPIYIGFPDVTSLDSLNFFDAIQQQVTTDLAQQQASIAEQRKQINNSDWRVRLRLAPSSQYLYNAPNPGILQPLANTDGVIFPYTPRIETAYRANYSAYDLTHSNYRGYFYQNSYVDPVNITCDFTAQDTTEADYLLAVITFFKAATKMFYGQDAERGAPPPLVYLSGLGEYQFNEHPLVISQFNLTLPNDVDYIRSGSVNVNGSDLLSRRIRQSLPTNPLSGALQRLYNLGQNISKGAEDFAIAPPLLGADRPTYVPTKMTISLTLLPVQSRAAVSKQFSLKSFANGDLIKGGFW